MGSVISFRNNLASMVSAHISCMLIATMLAFFLSFVGGCRDTARSTNDEPADLREPETNQGNIQTDWWLQHLKDESQRLGLNMDSPAMKRKPDESSADYTARLEATIINTPRASISKPVETQPVLSLDKWIHDGLRDGVFYSVDVDGNEVRMDPIKWSWLTIEEKQMFVRQFSRYFDAKDSTGRVTILSHRNDTKLGSYSVWTGIKIYQ